MSDARQIERELLKIPTNVDFTLAKVFYRFSVEATDTGSFDTRHTRTIQMILYLLYAERVVARYFSKSQKVGHSKVETGATTECQQPRSHSFRGTLYSRHSAYKQLSSLWPLS